MNTIVLIESFEDRPTLCRALCMESDYNHLLTNLPSHVSYMHESLVRVLFPEAYMKMILADLSFCIGIWIEELFNGNRDYKLDGDTLYTNAYIITATNEKITITTAIGCCAAEVSNLLLMIKDRIGDHIEIEVKSATFFPELCEN